MCGAALSKPDNHLVVGIFDRFGESLHPIKENKEVDLLPSNHPFVTRMIWQAALAVTSQNSVSCYNNNILFPG